MVRTFTRAAALLAILAGLIAPGAAFAAARRTAPADSTAIRATLDSLNAACARRDSVAFDALFDDDDRVLFAGSDSGEVFHGRAGVRTFRRFLFAMPFTFSFDLAAVTLGADGASGWAYVDGNMIHARPGRPATRRPYRFSVAMIRRGHTWKWQMFHGAVPGGE